MKRYKRWLIAVSSGFMLLVTPAFAAELPVGWRNEVTGHVTEALMELGAPRGGRRDRRR